MTREEKVAEARRLRAKGLTLQQIGDRMGGFSLKTVHTWLADPDLARQRARREKYSQPCPNCGTPMDGSSGYNGRRRPKVCTACNDAREQERNERIFAAWERGELAKDIGAREGMKEHAVLGLIHFHRDLNGEPLSRRLRHRRELWPRIERLWRQGLSGPEIARECGLKSASNVHEMLKWMRLAGWDVPRRR